MRKSVTRDAAPFRKIQLRYGLKKPEQIKMRILWLHIQQLIKVQFPGPETVRILTQYDRHWKACEKEEGL